MTRIVLSLAIVTLAACSSLPDAGGGIVALEIIPPDTLTVTIGRPLTLHARALDIHGDSVAAQIFWRTPDTTFVALDSVLGVLAGKSVGSARVQARVGTLSSDILTFTVRADTTATTTGIREHW